MTREECIEKQDEYTLVRFNNIETYVSPTGKVRIWNKKDKRWIERPWRYNPDGYPVVSIANYEQKIYNTIAVHRLVALGWCENNSNKPEVNHKDYNRKNPWAYNLEWVTHKENVEYSYKVGHYKGLFGADNPNYGNRTLHERYQKDAQFAKEKQSRPGGRNGKARPCELYLNEELLQKFDYLRGAIRYLQSVNDEAKNKSVDALLKNLLAPTGFNGYKLKKI